MNRIHLIIAGLVGVAAIATAVAVGVAQSGSGAATQDLNALATAGPDTAIVAIVNGQPITMHTIDVEYALAEEGSILDAAGRSTAALSKQELLNREIENVLLAQAAMKAGVVVTKAEVSLAIQSGLVGPLSSPDTPAKLRQVGLAALRANGVSLANAETDPAVRASYREFLLVERYASQSKQPRAERLAAARASATVQIFPNVLNAPR